MHQSLALPDIANPFVDYADLFSGQPHTQTTLEGLEIKHALNPNLLIFFIWFAQSQRGRLSKTHIKSILDNVCSWHERISLTLNRLHEHLSPETGNKLKPMQSALDTERALAQQVEQCLIADTLLKTNALKRNPLQQLADSCHALINYCKVTCIYLDPADWQSISLLLHTAFPELGEKTIQEACQLACSRSNQEDSAHSEQLSFIDF